jgi:hypothetical protein
MFLRFLLKKDESGVSHLAYGVTFYPNTPKYSFKLYYFYYFDSVTSSVHLFADDCLLYRTIKQEDDHQALQKDLKNLEEWANKWGMRFNAA